MKEAILKQLCNPESKCRVVFATIALGMGVGIPSVRQVVHIDPPRSVQEYYQQSGNEGCIPLGTILNGLNLLRSC